MIIKLFSMDLIIDDNYKTIHDNIHKYIHISNIAIKFIDNSIFKRLQSLHQLGTCYFVFNGPSHTRFEHSIGTYHLAGKLVDTIIDRTNQDELHSYLCEIHELDNYYSRYGIKNRTIDIYVKELIKIAGLCHDLGHGPFSHVFDDIFIKYLFNDTVISNDKKKYFHHEFRSCLLVELIWKNNPFLYDLIHHDEIKFIQSLINPPKIKHFIYQIISNNLNGLDVDKFDYINRDAININVKEHTIDISRLIEDVYVINNNITYPKQSYMDIINLFNKRYYLHKDFYSHKVVISIQYMIVDLMILIEPFINFKEAIFDMDKFILLNDDLILNFPLNTIMLYNKLSIPVPSDVIKAFSLIERINNRDLYKLIGHYVNTEIKSTSELSLPSTIDITNIIFHQSYIGYISGNKKKNPLESIWFYDKKKVMKKSIHNTSFTISKGDISYLIPEKIIEAITLIFSRNKLDEDLIKEINFHAKIFFNTIDSETPED
jgi:deoxynucleoside triphosphate triphosphohydrolase SAMHD1